MAEKRCLSPWCDGGLAEVPVIPHPFRNTIVTNNRDVSSTACSVGHPPASPGCVCQGRSENQGGRGSGMRGCPCPATVLMPCLLLGGRYRAPAAGNWEWSGLQILNCLCRKGAGFPADRGKNACPVRGEQLFGLRSNCWNVVSSTQFSLFCLCF